MTKEHKIIVEKGAFLITIVDCDRKLLFASCGPLVGMRHVQTALMFLCLTAVYLGRVNVSVGLVAMTNSERTNPNFPEYDWDGREKSYILSSFYWGYIWTQLLGGYLCSKIGVKIVLLLAVLGSGICSAIIPIFVPWGGWKIFCAIRVLQGLFQGVVFPSIHTSLAKWSPPSERTIIGALSYTGLDCGTVFAMAISGIIAEGPFGWPGIYYIAAAFAFAWCLLWLLLGANNATEANCISIEERSYIESSLKHDNEFHQRKIPTPWRAIFTSKPFYALISATLTSFWGYSTIQSQNPSYMNGVLHMDIKKNAMLSALPYLAAWILSISNMILADVIFRKELLSLTELRKTYNTIAFWIPAAALIAVGYVDENHPRLAVVLMVINVGIHSGATIGSALNSIDLACNHAGILMGILNTLSSVVPIISPIVVGVIVTNESDRLQWQIVFAIAAVFFFLGNLIFIIYGTAETQDWNDENFYLNEDTEKNNKNVINSSLRKI